MDAVQVGWSYVWNVTIHVCMGRLSCILCQLLYSNYRLFKISSDRQGKAGWSKAVPQVDQIDETISLWSTWQQLSR